MDHVRARPGVLSLLMVALLMASGCGQPEVPPSDEAPATPAPAEGSAPATPEGPGPEAEPAPSPMEGS